MRSTGSKAKREYKESLEEQARQLHLVVEALRGRLDGLEETVSGIERQMNEAAELGITQ